MHIEMTSQYCMFPNHGLVHYLYFYAMSATTLRVAIVLSLLIHKLIFDLDWAIIQSGLLYPSTSCPICFFYKHTEPDF